MTSRDGFEVVNGLARRMLDDDVTRRGFLRAVGWTGAAAALPLGRPGPGQGQARPKTGGTIKTGLNENIDTLDPHNTTIITACAVHNNIYSGLLKITYDGKTVDFKPELAREWEIQG